MMMSIMLKASTSIDVRAEAPGVSVKLSTSVIESSAESQNPNNNNNHYNNNKPFTDYDPRQKASSLLVGKYENQSGVGPKKLQQFKNHDAVLPDLRPYEMRPEQYSGALIPMQAGRIADSNSPNQIGQISNQQAKYNKSLATTQIISPVLGNQYKSDDKRRLAQQDQTIRANKVGLQRRSWNYPDTDFNCHQRSFGRVLKGKIINFKK